jgi:hypothetical protein
VRIRSSDEIAATLDAAGTLRGMPFLATQWTHQGTFEVERQVRRFLDGDARIHRMSTAVALRGVSCDGADSTPGCGRACSMFYRDEWLEPSEDPLAPPPERLMVRVKSEREIRATLDRRGTLDGMSFRPEMARFAGQRLPLLRRLEFDPGPLPWWKHARGEWYALAGARCEGEPFAATGGCDRGCAFAWHRSWLDMEGDPGHDGPEGRKPD